MMTRSIADANLQSLGGFLFPDLSVVQREHHLVVGCLASAVAVADGCGARRSGNANDASPSTSPPQIVQSILPPLCASMASNNDVTSPRSSSVNSGRHTSNSNITRV